MSFITGFIEQIPGYNIFYFSQTLFPGVSVEKVQHFSNRSPSAILNCPLKTISKSPKKIMAKRIKIDKELLLCETTNDKFLCVFL
jgi:hypothetical protein